MAGKYLPEEEQREERSCLHKVDYFRPFLLIVRGRKDCLKN